MSLLGIIFLVRAFIIYNPNFDLIQSGKKCTLLLWYNNYNWRGEYEGRKYIKLFEI